MKVLSLFDGISCGMVALERAGIPVENMSHTRLSQMQSKSVRRTTRRLNTVGMLQRQTSRSMQILTC